MLIAQLSDFHVTAEGIRAYGRVTTRKMLKQALRAVNGLPRTVDLVIGTGDLTHNGTHAEYLELRRVLRKLGAPFAPVMGNHDRRTELRHAFADFGRELGPDS